MSCRSGYDFWASEPHTNGRRPPKDQQHGIDFDQVELFKDYDELPIDSQDLTPASNQPDPPINPIKTDLSKSGPSAPTNGNTTSGKIYQDYDIDDLQLNKYKFMVAPNKYKTINATSVRFLSGNPSSVNNSDGSQIGIKQFEIKVSGQYLFQPNGTRIPGVNSANKLNNTGSGSWSRAHINSNNSLTAIPWIISPACQHNDDSKYLFSAIFSKKPTVHLLTADNGTVPINQTPKIVINDSSVTMSVGNETQTNDGYANNNSSKTNKSEDFTKPSNSAVAMTNNKTTPIKNPGELKIGDALKGLTEFTMTIQNNTKPDNYVTLSKVGNSLTISGQIDTHENDEKRKPPLLSQLNTTPQQTQQQTAQFIPKLQANVSVKTPTLTITAQGMKKIDPVPLLLLENSLRQTPIPGMTLNKTLTTAFSKPQTVITNILNSDLGERSFFPPELNQNFKRPTDKKIIGDLITQTETDIQPSDILYELFKNISLTNVINEDLNRKLLNESQIHTRQNWQLIKGNTDILNILKDKNEQ